MRFIFILACFLLSLSLHAQILSPREQSRVIDEILQERLDNLLPTLMDRSGIDMWVIISREYNEDPVLKTMLPSTWLSARRTTMLVFYRDAAKKTFDKFAIARYNVGDAIKASWDMQKFPDQWEALVDIIKTRNPRKIGINTSANFGHADGMDHTHYDMLMKKLPADLKSKVVSAEPLAVAWLETRTERRSTRNWWTSPTPSSRKDSRKK
jgi:hypothetical protein